MDECRNPGKPGVILVIKAEGTWAVFVGRKNGHTGAGVSVEMPFAEMTGCIAGILERLRQGKFLVPQGVAVIVNACAIVGATGQDSCARRGTSSIDYPMAGRV